jgi:hypothetical protein
MKSDREREVLAENEDDQRNGNNGKNEAAHYILAGYHAVAAGTFGKYVYGRNRGYCGL